MSQKIFSCEQAAVRARLIVAEHGTTTHRALLMFIFNDTNTEKKWLEDRK
jgi:hypothetical protein